MGNIFGPVWKKPGPYNVWTSTTVRVCYSVHVCTLVCITQFIKWFSLSFPRARHDMFPNTVQLFCLTHYEKIRQFLPKLPNSFTFIVECLINICYDSILYFDQLMLYVYTFFIQKNFHFIIDMIFTFWFQ